MMKRIVVLLTALCMFIALLPAVAGASAAPLEIKLTIGSPSLTINGVISTIEKPFQVNGTTLVPLSVITKAFGAGLKLENNKVITLTYNKTSVILTIGSKVVKVNGVASTLATEAKVINNTTMVPLRVIVSSFGATINAVGRQITIKGVKADAAGNTGGLDSDAGKSKVGDSYYSWSMNYPSELTLAYQSDNGDYTYWEDTTGYTSISVVVDTDDGDVLTKELLRGYIQDNFQDEDEIIIDKRSIKVGDLSMEKIITRSGDGWFNEYRALQSNGHVYLLVLGTAGNNKDVLTKWQSQLDSFKAVFSKNDSKLKDIAKVKDGIIQFANKDYGLTLQLPVDWTGDEDMPYYYNDDSDLSLNVSSLVENDTVEKWLERKRTEVVNNFASDYLRNVTVSTIDLKDGKAQVLSYEYSWDKKEWNKQREVLLVVGDYRYAFTFFTTVDSPDSSDSFFNQIMAAVDIDTAVVEDNFSYVEDESDTINAITSTTKTNKKYGYSIAIPSDWDEELDDFDDDNFFYSTKFGYFSVQVDDTETIDSFVTAYKANFEDNEYIKAAGVTFVDNGTTKLGSLTARKLTFHVNESANGNPYTRYYYLVESNNKLYIVMNMIQDAASTDSNNASVQKVLDSFTLK